MSYTLNDLSIQRALIHAPSTGVWVGYVNAEGSIDIGATAVIELGEALWQGSVAAVQLDGEVIRATVVGGAGKLGTYLEPRQWVGKVDASDIARTICDEVGERLQVTDALAAPVIDWQYERVTAGRALADLAKRLGVHWRVRASGEVAFNAEGVGVSGALLASDTDGSPIYSVDSADAEPALGATIEHELNDRGSLTTVVRLSPVLSQPASNVRLGVLRSQDETRVVVSLDGGGDIECSLWHGLQGVTAELALETPMLVIHVDNERHIAIAHPDSVTKPKKIKLDAEAIELCDGAATFIRDGDLCQLGNQIGAIKLLPPLLPLGPPPLRGRVKG